MSERSNREPRHGGFADEIFAPRSSRPSFAAPPPRQAPSGPPVRATVKWFSPEKGFGFVVLADGSGDAFLHAGALERAGHDPADLPPGTSLQVRIELAQKGPQVTDVLAIDTSTATPRPSRRAAEAAPAGGRSGRMTGTVKWYNPEKRFGFVAVDGGRSEVFVHATALQRSGLQHLAEGQRVTMEVAEGRKGLEALSVGLTG
jgi:cold shock protein